MSFSRRGTVSKASGPTHINSYALRNVPIKYKPPIYIPDLLYLPVDWKKPEMFSRERFRYDYSNEEKVLEQSKSRALSVAAEASLKRRQVEEVIKKQQEKEEAAAKAKELAKPRPPIDFSNDILTPTPVLSSSTSSVNNGNTGSSPLSDVPVSETDQSNSQHTQVSAGTPIVSLGEMSLREFEYVTNDPFEIASLQAINDMEVLQSVLQPIPSPVITSLVSVTVQPSPQTQTSGSPLSELGHDTITITQSSPLPTTTHANTDPTSSHIVHNPFYPSITQPDTIPPTQPFQPSSAAVPPQTIAVAANQNTPLSAGGLMSFEDSFVTNSKTATVSTKQVVSSPGNVSTMTGGLSSSETGVGLLVDIGGQSPENKDGPRPLPAVDQPQGTPSSPFNTNSRPHPVPKPRTHVSTPALGSSASSVYPAVSKYSPVAQSSSADGPQNLSPTMRPKSGGHNLEERSSPIVPPKGIKHERSGPAHVGFTIPSSNPTPPSKGLKHLGMGVQVLPPIPQSSGPFPVLTSQPQTSVPSSMPPVYEAQSPLIQPKISPPPPYSSPGQNPKTQVQPPKRSPRAYKLPDLQESLTSEQRANMESLAGMGFPSLRAARAIVRCGDNTEVLDFLFLVGKLEEENYNGDSAETALIVCKEDLDKAREYLKKVEGFKDIGFQESKIHEAHKRSSGDWDKALDCLTEGR